MLVIAKVIIKVIVDMITFANCKDIHEVFVNVFIIWILWKVFEYEYEYFTIFYKVFEYEYLIIGIRIYSNTNTEYEYPMSGLLTHFDFMTFTICRADPITFVNIFSAARKTVRFVKIPSTNRRP